MAGAVSATNCTMPTTTLEHLPSPLDNETTTTIPSTPATHQHHPPPGTTMQPLEWHYLPSSDTPNGSLIVAIWPTDISYQGLQTITSPPSPLSPTNPLAMTTPLIHVPRCYLSVTSYTPDNAHTPGLVERVGLPRSLVQGFLSSVRLPASGESIVGYGGSQVDLLRGVTPHLDDQDDWVFSRCLLADFTGFSEEAAGMLSRQGRLCCWISVVLDGSSGVWDLGFVVHRVGVCDGTSGKKDGKGGGCLRGEC